MGSCLEGLLGRLSIAALDAVQKTENRQVKLETSGSSGMPLGLHINYEEDFLKSQSHQVSRVFTDPLFLPSMANSVYKLVKPPVLGLPTTPAQTIGKSDAESDTTDDLEPKEGPSQPAQGSPFKSDHILRKQSHHRSDGSKDSKDGAPPSKRETVKKEKGVDDSESLSSAGLSDGTL